RLQVGREGSRPRFALVRLSRHEQELRLGTVDALEQGKAESLDPLVVCQDADKALGVEPEAIEQLGRLGPRARHEWRDLTYSCRWRPRMSTVRTRQDD